MNPNSEPYPSPEAFHTTLERLKVALEGGNLGTWDWHIPSSRVDFNDRWAEMLGYRLEEIEPDLSSWEKLAHPEDLKAVWPVLQAHLDGETEFYQAEMRMRHKDGRWIWIDDRGKVIERNERGEPIRVCGTHQDISSFKESLERIEESEARLSVATKSAGIGIWDLDIDNDVLLWDDRMFALYGLSPSEHGGAFEAWKRGVHPEDLERAVSEVLAAQRGEKNFDTTFRIIRPGGEVRRIKAYAEVVRNKDGKPERMIGVNYDITDSIEIQNRLIKISDQVPGVIYQYRLMPDGRSCFPYASEKIRDVYQVTPEQVREDASDVFDVLHPEDYDEVVESIQNSAETLSVWDHEYRVKYQDGTVRWLSGRASPQKEEDGSVLWHGFITDITVRKNGEKALLASEERYRRLAENSPAVVYQFRMDADGAFSFAYINESVKHILGVSAEDVKRDANTILCLIDEGRRDAFMEAILESARDLTPFEQELLVTSEAGARWMQVRSTPERLPDGGVIWDGFFYEITERKRAEEGLFRQSRLLEGISISSNILLCETDINRAIPKALAFMGIASGHDRVYVFKAHVRESDGATLVSQSYEWDGEGIEAQSGNSDLQNIPFSEVFSRWHEAMLRHEIIQGCFAEFPPCEREYLAQQEICSLIAAPIIISGEFWGFVGFDNCHEKYTWNTSEVELLKTFAAGIGGALLRNQSNRELRRLSTAIEQSPETVVITDVEGRIEYVNPAFEKVTGYTREEAIGQNPRILKSGRQGEQFYSEMWEAITGGRIWQGQIVNQDKDGKLYTEEASIAPVKDHSGEVSHFVAVKRNITEKLEREELLRQSQKMEAVGQLAGGVAHDFNNLLMGIMGYVDICRDELERDHPIQEYLSEIAVSAQRSADLTRQLLTFARKQKIAPRALDLNAAMTGILNMLQRLIGEDINLILEPGANLWPVAMDPSQVDQILANLCVNARDAISGVGSITIQTGNVEVDETHGTRHLDIPPGEYVMLSVTDTGCGMDEQSLAHVFEPFFTTKEAGKGTGLGLATVHGIMKQNNGGIDVTSEKGQGTTFRVYFPRLHKFDEGHEEKKVHDALRGGSETILLVEDESSIRATTEISLRKLGYKVLVAESPEQALEISKKHEGRIHMLLTDVVMPGMNGRELSERLIHTFPELKCVYMSGYPSDILAKRDIADESVNFLSKPFPHATLAGKVREVLDQG
ncbi:MAG: PAS domain-containing protein [Verrucomicrobia bacterium]|nr:PAS domain-containing protein [Kiritimatiellia bacterium]MCP5487754.1 PAS domain-containing protein [Verrucomicrobiota bacterium]